MAHASCLSIDMCTMYVVAAHAHRLEYLYVKDYFLFVTEA